MQDSLNQKVAQMEQKGVPRDDIIELLKLGASSVKHRTADTDPLSSLMWNAGAALACLSAGVAMYFLTSDMDLALPDWCNAGRANENQEAEISVIMHYEYNTVYCKVSIRLAMKMTSSSLYIIKNPRGVLFLGQTKMPLLIGRRRYIIQFIYTHLLIRKNVVAENNNRNGR